MARGVVLAMLLAACTGDRAAVIAPEDFDAAARAQYCDALFACGEIRDRAMCDRLDLPKEWPQVTSQDRADLAAGIVTWDAEAAARCVHQAPSCDRTSRANVPACEPLLAGELGDGDACRRDEMCASGDCLRGGSGCSTGTCLGDVAFAPGHLGDRCHGDSCVEGWCGSDRCAPFRAAGDACDDDRECAAGLACRYLSNTANNRTCLALPATGEACAGECAQLGDICDTGTLICTPGGLEGATCANDADCLAFYRCDGIPDGHCRRLEAAIGERCDYLPCVRGAVCSFKCEPAPDATCP